MSEPMDLDSAKKIVATEQTQSAEFELNIRPKAEGFIEGAASERRALMEKFRPVILKIQESINLMGGPVMDYSTLSANQERKKYIDHGTKILIEAIALWRDLEKENGQ